MTECKVSLDPDGTNDFGLLLVVQSTDGVRYAHQVAGYACEQRVVQGFVIPLGPPSAADSLVDFFATTFHGNPPLGGWHEWTAGERDECARLVAQVKVLDERREQHATWASLAVDSSRGIDVTEGWVPVESPYGPAVLLFRNSD